MPNNAIATVINQDDIISRICTIRGQKVILDRDIAALYGVETRRLNEQVKRNINRFPKDFMFQLNESELENWKSQFATSNAIKMGLRKLPFAFTQEGVAMLSSVLSSENAIRINILIMRAFVRIRRIMLDNVLIQKRLDNVELKITEHDLTLERVLSTIDLMQDQPRKPLKNIGFITPEEKE